MHMTVRINMLDNVQLFMFQCVVVTHKKTKKHCTYCSNEVHHVAASSITFYCLFEYRTTVTKYILPHMHNVVQMVNVFRIVICMYKMQYLLVPENFYCLRYSAYIDNLFSLKTIAVLTSKFVCKTSILTLYHTSQYPSQGFCRTKILSVIVIYAGSKPTT